MEDLVTTYVINHSHIWWTREKYTLDLASFPVWGREWDQRKEGVLHLLLLGDHVNSEEEGIFWCSQWTGVKEVVEETLILSSSPVGY